MTSELQIRVEPRRGRGAPDSRRLSIRLGEACLTELIRRGSSEPDQCLDAPPLPLAFWLVDNWWRIRCEPPPQQQDFPAEWQLAHHLPSVGAGYPWPNISLWGEGHRSAIAVHANIHNLQPSLRFLAEPALEYVASETVDRAIDAFIGQVIQELGADCDGLNIEHRELLAERTDPAVSAWRRIEAMLGFDPDDAPEGQIAEYEAMAGRFGTDGVEEAALAQQGERSVQALQEAIEVAESSNVVLHAQHEVRIPLAQRAQLPPWRLATDAARDLRARLRIAPGPIRNPALSEVLGMNIDRLTKQRSRAETPYALRLREESGNASRLALRSRWSQGRRFELCRSLSDVIWSGNDALGPLSTARSTRQKFQRAFAQEFLCPFDDLRAYIPDAQPAEDDIEAAARYFHVSERLVQSTLANHNVIDRETFAQMVEAA